MLFSISFLTTLAWCVCLCFKLWKTQLNETVCWDEFPTNFDGLDSNGRGIISRNIWFVTFYKDARKGLILGEGETFVIDEFCVIFPTTAFSLSAVPSLHNNKKLFNQLTEITYIISEQKLLNKSDWSY